MEAPESVASESLLSRRAWKRRFAFWFGAILLGGIAAGFALMADFANITFGRWVTELPYLPFILTPLGFTLISISTNSLFPNAQGSGIPQTIAALETSDHEARKKLLSLRIAFGKVTLCCLAILCGASMGREGPTVHVGASIFFWIGTLAHFHRHDMDKGLILAGGAAGVAAAFNTPLAGIVFAIEELSRSFEERNRQAVISAVLLAGVTAILILGRYTHFGHSDASVPLNFIGLGLVVVTGVVCGLAGGIFAATLIHALKWIAPKLKAHPILVPAILGLIVATIGFLSGNITFGSGYKETQDIMANPQSVTPWYPLLKMLATLSSAMSGVPGGFFAPSLATGAGLGDTLSFFFPAQYADALILLGMVGFFAGMIQAPITAFVIIMEMTDNGELLLPLMGTAFIAFGISQIVCPTPVYTTLAKSFLPKRTL